jgi:PknH-like extracellular domain
MRLGLRVFIAVVLAGCGLTGCAKSIDGRAVAPADHSGRPVAAVDLDSGLLTPSQVFDIVGAQLTVRVDQKQPVGGGPSGPCAGLDNADVEAFVGDGYTAFHVLLLADGTDTDHDHVVTQAVSIYPDAQTAAKQFGSTTTGLGPCNRRLVRGDADWKYAVNDVTADSVRWNKQQTDLPMPWVCYGQARVRNNVIVEAVGCQDSDTVAQNVDTLVNHMSASVWNLSGGR